MNTVWLLWQQSFFSGEEYYRGKRGDEWRESERDLDGLHTDDLFGHIEGGELRTLQGQVQSWAYVGMSGTYGLELTAF